MSDDKQPTIDEIAEALRLKASQTKAGEFEGVAEGTDVLRAPDYQAPPAAVYNSIAETLANIDTLFDEVPKRTKEARATYANAIGFYASQLAAGFEKDKVSLEEVLDILVALVVPILVQQAYTKNHASSWFMLGIFQLQLAKAISDQEHNIEGYRQQLMMQQLMAHRQRQESFEPGDSHQAMQEEENLAELGNDVILRFGPQTDGQA